LAARDEYTFDFLELGDEHSEQELERALLGRIENLLRAMGGTFALMGGQYRPSPEDQPKSDTFLENHRY
jgi:predicted nuclease of restriction endonuclease-like (RecB) superfamily